ncbi:MAG: archaeosortase/exosortase family protein [Bacteroidota bacterium]
MFKSPLVQFALKALGIFVAWYILYELWLLPDGRLDEWLSLNIIGNVSGILQLFGYDIYTVNRIIGVNGFSGVELVDGCNGISAMGLFFGFIFAFPGAWKEKAYFSIFGVLIIYLINILRVVVLTVTKVEWPSLFDFTHDYSTTAIFYLIIFLMWVLWVKVSETTIPSAS